MPETIQDPKLVVRDTIRNKWNNANVPSDLGTNDIHVGWYDDGKGFPQIAVSNRNENISGGGATGFSGIAGDGSGATQNRRGTVLVTAFAGSRDDYETRGFERLQANDMGDEISRVLGSTQSPDEYLSLAVGPREELIDNEQTPAEYAVQFQIIYIWKKEPPRS